ncbi:nucleic acid-binding protein [Sodiomyces alkalinus F11]|uniref:Single-stranded DNA-binding protein n=1 Tax=Sodiomyces alkalinus (strain CBS 110278 / VKM F-3762 / F11) TaxID=1314773 RepID=A0A3N2PWM6_SODAK|nr:nucleic acid-binding protein [Sodiomyces alkalinus F11]ROT38796.1 nucleic acid-binding protein [Sodiomyces alkalinus F11]
MSAALRRVIATPRLAARSFSTTSPRGVARITIVGNLADTPELQATSTGHEVLKYAIASNSGPRDNRHTSWFRVSSFEPQGPRRDYLQSLPKGSLVYVEGDATMNTYQDAEGKTRSSLSIIQRNVEVLRRPGNPSGE